MITMAMVLKLYLSTLHDTTTQYDMTMTTSRSVLFKLTIAAIAASSRAVEVACFHSGGKVHCPCITMFLLMVAAGKNKNESIGILLAKKNDTTDDSSFLYIVSLQRKEIQEKSCSNG